MSLNTKRSRVAVLTAAGALTIGAWALPSAANATSTYSYVGSAGGTRVNAVGATVTSSATAPSLIAGSNPGHTSNTTATVTVKGLLKVGTISTSASAQPDGDGIALTTNAETASVNILNGLVTVDAVNTTAQAAGNSTSAPSSSTSTTLVGLTISGKDYPADPAPNTTIGIPGVATVTLNATTMGSQPTAAATSGAGIVVTLLKARNGVAAGAQILVNPVFAAVEQRSSAQGGAQLGGAAYGSYVHANVGSSVDVESGQTAYIGMPGAGTNGAELVNSTAHAKLAGVLDTGAIESTATGTSTTALSQVEESATVDHLNLFNGLIQATAIGSTSDATKDDSGISTSGSLQFIHLKINGKLIPIDVKPNTTINVARLGAVTINEQDQVAVNGIAHGYQVIGLHIILNTARAGLPVGADVQVATSQAIVYN